MAMTRSELGPAESMGVQEKNATHGRNLGRSGEYLMHDMGTFPLIARHGDKPLVSRPLDSKTEEALKTGAVRCVRCAGEQPYVT
jgi:hypothetical protein